MVFFSRNRKTAIRLIKRVSKEDDYFKDKTVRLARKQIEHKSKWKTWKIIKKR